MDARKAEPSAGQWLKAVRERWDYLRGTCKRISEKIARRNTITNSTSRTLG